MSKYPAPLPHDTEAEDKEFHAAFADAMRKAAPFSPPAQKPASVSGDSGAGLVENPFAINSVALQGNLDQPAQKTALELGASVAGLVENPTVSVLFARSDSCYLNLVSDVWDIRRDARGYQGPNSVICHPPCRGWGRLSHLAKPRHDEKALGLFAAECVRKYGGVLEHPWASKLWDAALLPRPGVIDAWGGYTILVEQGWFGHAAPKPTWLYICGLERSKLPTIPVQLHRAEGKTLELSPADRERTPPEFARFLIEIAGACNRPAVTSGQGVRNNGSVTSGRHDLSVTRSGRRASYIDLADCLIG